MNSDIGTYTCPYSNIDYKGMCPVVDCPANVSHLLRRSGCAFNFLNGKKELDESDLAYAFDVSVDSVREQTRIGQQRIRLVVLLNDILTRLKEHDNTPSCPDCGVLKTAKGPCLNRALCNERKETLALVCEGFPYNNTELPFEKRDIFLLIKNLKRLREFLRGVNEQTASDIKITTLLGIPKPTLDKLKELVR